MLKAVFFVYLLAATWALPDLFEEYTGFWRYMGLFLLAFGVAVFAVAAFRRSEK